MTQTDLFQPVATPSDALTVACRKCGLKVPLAEVGDAKPYCSEDCYRADDWNRPTCRSLAHQPVPGHHVFAPAADGHDLCHDCLIERART